MQPWLRETWTAVHPHLPTIAAALAILIGGWIIALIARGIAFAALKRTTLDDKLARALGIDVGREGSHRLERGISRVVYYIVLAFVIVAFLEQLQIKAVTEPIVGALSGITRAIPSVLKAAVIVLLGFAIALFVKRLLLKLFDKTGLMDRLGRLAGEEDPERSQAAGKIVASVAFWFILLMTLIPALEALEIGALAVPLSAAIGVVSTYLPKVIGAGLLLLVGYFLGRLAKGVIKALSDKSGLDRGLQRLGLSAFLGNASAGSILGTLAMAFVVLHFAISAVGKLQIDEISGPLGLLLQQIYDYLPKFLVGLLLIALGVVLGRIVARAARAVLAGLGFNALLVHIGLSKGMTEAERKQAAQGAATLQAGMKRARGDGDEVDVETVLNERSKLQTPSDIAGSVIGAVVVLVFLRQALSTLELHGLGQLVDSFLSYLPNVLVALVVLAAGMWAGRWARTRIDQLTRSSSDNLMRALGPIARVAVITVAVMVALQQLGVATQLIGIAFTLILGGLSLAAALAFGLGSREVAGDIVKRHYDEQRKSKGRPPVPQR